MLDDFFGDDGLAGQTATTVEKPDRTCADDLELPPAARRRFAGLKNQGATCYLNSFFQLMFQMPELRQLFLATPVKFDSSWKTRIFNGFKRLFARLKYLDAHSQTTEFMNEVFGWNKSEMLNQHDIQEAIRIIFGYLEDAFKGMPLQGTFDGLLKGKTDTFTRCLECGQESLRSDDFWDIYLNVRGHGGVLNPGLEEALKDAFATEKMQGDNRYQCENCQKKVDAERGTRLGAIPEYLSFYVNRFDYDPATYERKKLKNEFDFPQLLDMSPYTTATTNPHYEFFAGIIHRGTAYSGHYHAIIRDLEATPADPQPSFYDFNDTIINAVDLDYISKFKKKGEENFYLLIYRRKEPHVAQELAPLEDEIMMAVRFENAQITAARSEYERMKQCIKVNVANLGALMEAGTVSAEDLQTHEGDIDPSLNPRFTLDKSNPSAFYDQVSKHFGVDLDNFRLFLARFKYNGSIYYVEQVDFRTYTFAHRDGVGMNSQILLVEKSLLDFPVFLHFRERDVS